MNKRIKECSSLLVLFILLFLLALNKGYAGAEAGLALFIIIIATVKFSFPPFYIYILSFIFAIFLYYAGGGIYAYYIPAVFSALLPGVKLRLEARKKAEKFSFILKDLKTRLGKLEFKKRSEEKELEKLKKIGRRLVRLYEISREIENILKREDLIRKSRELFSGYPVKKIDFYRDSGSADEKDKGERCREGDIIELKSGNRKLGSIEVKGRLAPEMKNDMEVIAGQLSLGYEKALLYEKVEELSRVDGLTGLYRRNYFMLRLSEEIKRAKREKYPIALIMADIDRFKKYNDTYGHLMGDEVLSRTADNILKNIYESDFAGRYGGEEFIIYMPRASVEEAYDKMERIRKLINKDTPVSISAGISSYPSRGKRKEELIEKADSALYLAKSRGRNRTLICGSEE